MPWFSHFSVGMGLLFGLCNDMNRRLSPWRQGVASLSFCSAFHRYFSGTKNKIGNTDVLPIRVVDGVSITFCNEKQRCPNDR